ncbi:MAG: HDOD domain-containing protein [Proteobacteria bacterium]|nr:HDOD domain-containing protein [Pseudomonadota bacterium]
MAEMDAAILKKAEERTQNRFRYTDKDHIVIEELVRLCVSREYAALSGENDAVYFAGPSKPEDNVIHLEQKDEPFDLAGKKIMLPSLPIIFTQIVSLMGNSNSSANDFAEVIRMDPPLAARLLKLVNSSFYGLRHRVDTVSSAVSVVGTKALYSLVLSMSVIKTFKDIPENFVTLPSFWSHSIACGVIAKRIAEYKKIPETERFFVAGLLHDIGRLVIFNYLPFRAKEAFEMSWENDEPLHQSEKKVLEHDHAKFGGLLLKFWKLSDILVDMVMFHHLPGRARHRKEVSVIHFADIITNGMQIGSSGERFVPPLNFDAWKYIELPVQYFEKLFEIVGKEVSEVTRIITPSKNKPGKI